MRIFIKDNAGIEQALEFDYRHSDWRYMLFGHFINDMRRMIKKAGNILDFDAYTGFDADLIFTLEQREDDRYLAVFRPSVSKPGEYRFSIYYSTVKKYAEKFIKENRRPSLKFLEETIMHEMIHAMDLPSLKWSNAIMHDAYRQFLVPMEKRFEHEISPFMLLSLMKFFSKFRNEGIALLGTSLLSQPSGHTYEPEEIFDTFAGLFQYHYLLAKKGNIARKSEYHHLRQQTDKVLNQAYALADIIMLYVLDIWQALPEGLEKYLEYIKGNSQITLDLSQKQEILHKALQIDLPSYIQALLKIKHGNKHLIDPKTFLNVAGQIQRESNYDDIQLFLNGILEAGHQNNPAEFVRILEELMGIPMTLDEIKEGMEKMGQKKYEDKTFRNAYKYARYLHQYLENGDDKQNIALWALTYFLDDQDVIYDYVPGLGFQDDLMILQTAYNFIQTS